MQYRHTTNRHFGPGIAIASLSLLLPPLALAQSNADMLEAVGACQQVTGRAARLSCYDRAFPPIAESADDGDALPSREELAAAAARSEPELPSAIQIVEVETPTLGTTIFHAADGRVFVRENATSTPRWPDTPFDAEVQTNRFGTSTYLRFPAMNLRVRVVVRD